MYSKIKQETLAQAPVGAGNIFQLLLDIRWSAATNTHLRVEAAVIFSFVPFLQGWARGQNPCILAIPLGVCMALPADIVFADLRYELLVHASTANFYRMTTPRTWARLEFGQGRPVGQRGHGRHCQK